jgi:hypothetical protein
LRARNKLSETLIHSSEGGKGMSDHVEPSTGDEQEVSSSGLLLSVDPLPGSINYKLSADDDTSDVSGADSDKTDSSDSDASDSDADGTDASDADGTDTGRDADGTSPLGIGGGDGTDTTDSK